MTLTTTLRSNSATVLAISQQDGAITETRLATLFTGSSGVADCLDSLSLLTYPNLTPSGDTSGAADTAAINSAAANGGLLHLAPGNFYWNLNSITFTNKVGFVLRGSGKKSTIINLVGTSGDCVTFNGCDNCGIENLMFQGNSTTPPTGGFALKFTGNCFECWSRDILYSFVYNACYVHSSTETRLFGKTMMRPICGPYGVLFDGTSSLGSARLLIEDIASDVFWQTPFTSYAQIRGNWAASTSYAVGDLAAHNSNIYQCVTAGTSGSSGPSGLSFVNNVNDGSASWRFIFSISLTWITLDSYAGSLVIKAAALIDGAWGLAVTDTAGGGMGVSASQWVMAYDLEIDHPYFGGVLLTAGAGFYATDCWIGSCLNGNGIDIQSTYSGEVDIVGTRVFGNAQHGILIEAPGLYGGISRCCISTNSVSSPGNFDGIAIAAGCSNFSIQDNYIGPTSTGATNYQSYGILVAAGASDHYQITNNNCPGNANGAVFDGGTGSNKVVANNNT